MPPVRVAVLELAARRQAAEDDEALDDAIFLAELRYVVEGARTHGENLLRRYRPDWDDRLGRIYARFAD
jgi:hypothetical protein